jgi:hypothetical protein
VNAPFIGPNGSVRLKFTALNAMTAHTAPVVSQ